VENSAPNHRRCGNGFKPGGSDAVSTAAGTERSRKWLERLAHSVLMFALLLALAPAQLFAAETAAAKAYNKPYRFTVNTFTDKIPVWTKLLAEFKGKAGVHYLEVGTFEGRSALWVLENLLTHPTAKLTIIDAFEENSYKTFMSNVALSGEGGKFNILVGLSTHKLREVPFNSIDLAYIDGSGKGIVMLSDLINTWNLVKVGGVIMCSRYSVNGRLRRALHLLPGDPGPPEAIDAFVKMYNPYISVLTSQTNLIVVRKTRSAE